MLRATIFRSDGFVLKFGRNGSAASSPASGLSPQRTLHNKALRSTITSTVTPRLANKPTRPQPRSFRLMSPLFCHNEMIIQLSNRFNEKKQTQVLSLYPRPRLTGQYIA